MPAADKRAYARAWRAANREKANARQRAYYARHKQEILAKQGASKRSKSPGRKAYAKAWKAANRAALNAQQRAYYAKNAQKEQARRDTPEKRAKASAAVKAWRAADWSRVRAMQSKRRVAAAGNGGRATPAQISDRVAFYGSVCAYRLPGCTGAYEHLDHVIPVARGGTGWPANLRPACRSCNLRKGTKRLW